MGGRPRRKEEVGKVAKDVLRELQKCIILADFSKDFKTCVNFSRVWTKKIHRWEILKKTSKLYCKNSIEKID